MSDDDLDPKATFETLEALPKPERPGQYGTTYATAIDRYRDFRAVFGTDQGKRVLLEILAWGHMFRRSYPPGGVIDPLRMAIAEGERSIAIKTLETMQREPPQNLPERQRQ